MEARYVRRGDDYFVVYLSSQTGCVQACRMCHLTATGQTKHRNATLDELVEQASVVLEHYDRAKKARTVHYNFMARGEPLANPVITEHSAELFDELWNMARARNLHARFLVSTILPKTSGDLDLVDVFPRYQPEIYYSLYSTNEAFRKRWLPKAQPVDTALDRLSAWQRHSYKLVKIHYAFIEGQNDSADDVNAVCDAIEARRLSVHVNIVRYNPPSPRHGSEPADDVLERNAGIFRARLPNARIRVIPRVGFDVHASCGMFVGGS
jgi:adenine C2-methylase RlmN of 23S rRNA A2503 and tRNA A37